MNKRELLKASAASVAAESLRPLARVFADGPVESLPDGFRITLQTGEIAVVWGDQIIGPDLNIHGEQRPNRKVVYAVASKENAMRLEFRGRGLNEEVNQENAGVHDHMALDGATWEVGTARMQAEFARRRRERNPLRAILFVRRSASRDPETGGLLLDPLEERHLDERGIEVVFEREIAAVQPAAKAAEASPAQVQWFGQNDFTTKDAEIPFGDRALWSYMQVWDGRDLNSVVHVAVAPQLVVRVNRGWVGAQWHLSGRDDARWEEMRREVQARDKLAAAPPLVVVDSTALDQRLAQRGWTVQEFPRT